MPIQHQFTVACEYSALDSNGKPTFAGVFSIVQLDKIPDVIHTLGIGIGFIGESDDPLSVVIRKPDGSALVTLALKKKGNPVHSSFPFVVIGTMLPNLEIREIGTYHIVLQEGDVAVHEMPFLVMLKEDSTEGIPTTDGK